MSRPCAICIHESRPAIEQAMINGRPKAEIARNFGFTYTSKTTGQALGDHKVVARHEPHLKGAVAAAANEREIKSGLSLLNRLERLDQQVDWVITEARKGTVLVVGDTALLDDEGKEQRVYDLRLLLAAVAQGRHNAVVTAQLTGAIPDGKEDEMVLVRRLLDTPEGRKLLAAVDALDAQENAGTSRAD